MMGTDHDPELFPVGPGRHLAMGDRPPAFGTDPVGWFRWLDTAIATGQPLAGALRPDAWTDVRGHVWRVVLTPEGLEIRPGFGAIAGEAHDLPRITAILVSPPLLHVDLAWRTGREVSRLGADEVSLCDLGVAMLTATELPHQSIPRVDAETWQRAHDRWRELARPSERAPVS